MRTTEVTCAFNDRDRLDQALDKLKAAGFDGSDISILMPGSTTKADAADPAATTAMGAGAGAVLGGTFGWLAALGAVAVPGVGPFLAVGPLAAALAGAGTGGALGGIAGALLGLGLSETDALAYEGRARAGDIIVSVRCRSNREIQKARSLLAGSEGEILAVPEFAPGTGGDIEPGRTLASQVSVEQSDIEKRAYEIWEREGRPEGRSQEHWNKAVRELQG